MDNTLFNLEGTQYTKVNGGIAQLGERLPCKQEVNGSIPFISTIQYDKILKKLRFILRRIRSMSRRGLIAQQVRARA